MDNQKSPEQPGKVDANNGGAEKLSPSSGVLQLLANRYLTLLLAISVFLVWYLRKNGIEDGVTDLWNWTKAILGLSLIIFVHELGHFAVAKWCDVHVETFSIGFGPALPGCSFQKGETLYKIALIPLGGYVKMVGEGTENEEQEDDPRSFKNKTVGQRMAIISAGVIMNILMAGVCFVVAYEHGVDQQAAVIGAVEINSPAWIKGLRSGSAITQIGNTPNPYFEDLLYIVMLSDKDESIHVVARHHQFGAQDFYIKPRKENTDSRPIIGVSPVRQLKLLPKEARRHRPSPVQMESAAKLARALDLAVGDKILAISDPQNPDQLLPLVRTGDYQEFSKRLRDFAGREITVRIKHSSGAEEQLVLPPDPFQFEDHIVATTDDSNNEPFDPYRIKDLPLDPRDPDGKNLDFFEYERRMNRLADQPVVIRVRRDSDDRLVNIFVPPDYQYTIPGTLMQMGPIAGIRDDSSGEKAGVKANDFIKQIELKGRLHDKPESMLFTTKPMNEAGGKPFTVVLDPLRLPFELRKWASKREKVTAQITVDRQDPDKHSEEFKPLPLIEVPWDSSWQDNIEFPGIIAPLSIPELGIAYRVKTVVAQIEPGSQAEKDGLREQDVVLEFNTRKVEKTGKGDWESSSIELWSSQKTGDGDKRRPEDYWAGVSSILSNMDYREAKLLVKRAGEDKEIMVSLAPDHTWPTANRGLHFLEVQRRLQKAQGFGEALGMGLSYTGQMIVKTYLGLKSMITNRISFTKSAAGPLTIATTAQSIAGRDWVTFLVFLGLININLAVVNFLPIPLLDGGHMVFLLYEKLRGKPPSEKIREGLSYAGAAVIISLLLVVTFLDVRRMLGIGN